MSTQIVAIFNLENEEIGLIKTNAPEDVVSDTYKEMFDLYLYDLTNLEKLIDKLRSLGYEVERVFISFCAYPR